MAQAACCRLQAVRSAGAGRYGRGPRQKFEQDELTLIGGVRHTQDSPVEERRESALRAAEMNIIASRHFTAGMRAIFFGLAYLGWFLGPYVLVISTIFVILVLARRQYFSQARRILID